ncbi:MAG: peptidoglycan DD-metalloendopeptidase family protein [Polymorphobacter sp.]
MTRRFSSAATGLVLAGSLALGVGGCAPDRARRPSVEAVPPPAAAPPAKPAWQARKVVADAVTVPGGRLHTVKPGETGIAIARAYGADWGKIAAANSLKPPYVLEVGDKLLLPSARQVAAMSVEDRARAFQLNIDDIITGGEPAARKPPAKVATAPRPDARPSRPAAGTPAKTGITPPPAQAGITPPPVQTGITPLPVLTGEAPRFGWPVDGRIISGFGAKPGGRFNDGVNLKASAGSPVRAAGDGVVAYAGDAIPGFGNLVLVKHAGGWVTAYGHNEALLVTRGKRIGRGDVIARAGATGAVNEPQVHFELRKGRTPVDPVKVIGGR